jgi:hypothetical protein
MAYKQCTELMKEKRCVLRRFLEIGEEASEETSNEVSLVERCVASVQEFVSINRVIKQ